VIIASFQVSCPTSSVVMRTHDTGEISAKTSLNLSVEGGPGVYWRAYLVDLRP
jgi:hypothetical protein